MTTSQPDSVTTDPKVIKPFGSSQPAHPAIEIKHSTGPGPVATSRVFHTGLTKREMFAAMAMQGLCANSIPGSHHHADERAREAVLNADALLKELAK